MNAVWLHGAGLSSGFWDPARARGLRLDLPGHGSRPRAPRPSVECFAEAIEEELPERADYVGHSLGGMVAMILAARFPHRVRRLVLVETAPGIGSGFMARAGGALARMLTRALGPRGIARLSATGETGTARRAMLDHVGAADPGGLRDAMVAATAFDGGRAMERIEAPTLILRGARNVRTRRPAAAMLDAIARARVVELPGGHLLPADCPDAFYGAVDGFLREDP